MFELFHDATSFVVMYKWPSNLIPSNQSFLQTIFAKWFAIAWKIYNAVKFFGFFNQFLFLFLSNLQTQLLNSKK